MNTQLFSTNLTDKSIIRFEEIFAAYGGGYYRDEVIRLQWDITNHVNLCMFDEPSYINDLTQMEREIFIIICRNRAAKQQEMEYAIKYAGVVPHVADKIELGAILYSSWGYEQTTVDYYCVVECSKAMCKILPMNQVHVDGGGYGAMSEHVKAGNLIDFGGELLRKKINKQGSRESLRIESFASAWLWDGKEKYQSHYH